jgi:hypothetical protein
VALELGVVVGVAVGVEVGVDVGVELGVVVGVAELLVVGDDEVELLAVVDALELGVALATGGTVAHGLGGCDAARMPLNRSIPAIPVEKTEAPARTLSAGLAVRRVLIGTPSPLW